VTFDELGICTACRSSEEKMHISWAQRETQLKSILAEAKKQAGTNYDCVLPASGGKDSFFQAHVLVKKYQVKPLVVTFSHNWFSETGFYNLQLMLETFGLDQLQFTPARQLVNRIAKKSLYAIGDSCWHCHAGVGAFPFQVAARFGIRLLVYGESTAENDGRSTFSCPAYKIDSDYFIKASALKRPKEMVDQSLTAKDLHPFESPPKEILDRASVRAIHLGDYMFWDEERQTEFIKKQYGWRETEVEGAYKGYKSAECIMAGVHDYSCYVKRGFGRTTWQAAVDVRNGLLSREEGFELVKKYDSERPEALDYYLRITGLSEKQFEAALRRHQKGAARGRSFKKTKKTKKNAENTYPFIQQVLDKHRGAGEVQRDKKI
jgi:N-acetyl sugar amidotransferase